MPASVTVPAGTLYAFLLVLARVGGAMSFVPLPGFNAALAPPRVMFVLGFTIALFPFWPAVASTGVTPGVLMVWVGAESAVGIAIGMGVAILLEAFLLAGQVLGLQAGYAYAQTVDPNTQADSGILLVLAQLAGGICFFALGLDRDVLRLFAQTLLQIPPGTYVLGPKAAEAAIRMCGLIFSAGVRMALPVVALLVLVDVALALLGRLNGQLQLLHLAFPAKMLVALLVLSWIVALFPRILRDFSGLALAGTRRMLGL